MPAARVAYGRRRRAGCRRFPGGSALVAGEARPCQRFCKRASSAGATAIRLGHHNAAGMAVAVYAAAGIVAGLRQVAGRFGSKARQGEMPELGCRAGRAGENRHATVKRNIRLAAMTLPWAPW